MKERINLINPIMINGKNVRELTYDSQEVTTEMFLAADGRAQWTAARTGTPKLSSVIETDASLHLYLAYMAIIAVNPDIDITDLERIKGVDIFRLVKIGRNFIKANTEEGSESEGNIAETSDETSEATAKPSTLELETLEE